MCRQRKVKCDKLTPCTNCQRLGAVCVPVQRPRLPRGRVRRAAESPSESGATLKDRVVRVEQLLEELLSRNKGIDVSSHEPQSRDGIDQESESEARRAVVGPPATNRNVFPQKPEMYLGSTFWEDLLHQTRNVQNVTDRPSEGQRPPLGATSDYGTALLGRVSPHNLPGSLASVPQVRELLCQVFLDRVDPVFKILHRPSLREFLQEGKPYLNYEPGHAAPEALACAVCYAAACSLGNEDCRSMFGKKKEFVTAMCQRETEAALVTADVVTTNDLTVLQAYVLSLVSARSQNQGRRVWTMLSMALRVAQALSLHYTDPPFPVRPFERELRRRLYQAIGLLDVQASLDRASEPMMQAVWLESHTLSNANDDDIRFNMEEPVQASDEFTDTTFTLILAKAQYALRSLNFSDFSEPGVKYMHLRQQVVRDFQQTASNLLCRCQPDAIDFHWFTWKSAECIHASLQLIALRPLQRNANFTPPRVKEPAGLLDLAANVVQKTQELSTDPRGHLWGWFESIFAPWHALAVAIAEICVCDDPSLMEKYFPIVEKGYDRFSSVVTDSQQRMLWGPMEKIMSRARRKRHELLEAVSIAAEKHAQSHFPTTATDSSQQPSFSGDDWQSQLSFPLIVGQESSGQEQMVSSMGLPEPCNWLDPWPTMWDEIDPGYGGIDNLQNTSWSNYEMFIEGIYESNESMSILG